MDRIERRLKEWHEQGLLDTATRQRLLAYEAGRERGHWRALLVLGALVAGIGVISLIAANWANIPDGLKLGADFTLLAALAVAVWNTQPGSARRETLIVLFQLLCLASIGLIAQIYHLGGRPWQALAAWSAMCLPITLHARARPAWWLWGSLALLAFALAVDEQLSLRAPRLEPLFDEGPLLYAWLAGALLAGIVHQLAARWEWRKAREVFGFWWLFAGLGYVALIDAMHSLREFPNPPAGGLYLVGGLAILLLLGIAARRDLRPASRLSLGLTVLLVLAASHPEWLFFPIHASDTLDSQHLRAAALSLLVLAGGLLAAGLEGWSHLFQLFTLLIGLRFFVIYLQAFAGLAATGIGLILSGLLIIALVVLWRHSLKLFERLRGGPR